MHWIIPALIMLTLNTILTYFDVHLTAKVLGVFLITEIIMLSLGALAVLVHGGGPNGFAVSETLNPIGAFSPALLTSPTPITHILETWKGKIDPSSHPAGEVSDRCREPAFR